jgi:hypothetical protein
MSPDGATEVFVQASSHPISSLGNSPVSPWAQFRPDVMSPEVRQTDFAQNLRCSLKTPPLPKFRRDDVTSAKSCKTPVFKLLI